ncbi:TPA: hypothetical protein ACH3X1_007149 [Trebouxia sp. C0004]
MLRYSKRRNLVVFGIAEGSACATPEALAAHLQSLMFEDAPSSAAPLVSCACRLGKWKAAQRKSRAVLVELTTVSAKHRALKASSRLRASRIRLDEDLTPQQMQQRKGLSTDFLGLKIRGFKPFFRGVVGICMVLEQSLVEVCLKGLNGVSMCPVVWEWCMNACEKSVRWCLHVFENMSVRMMV